MTSIQRRIAERKKKKVGGSRSTSGMRVLGDQQKRGTNSVLVTSEGKGGFVPMFGGGLLGKNSAEGSSNAGSNEVTGIAANNNSSTFPGSSSNTTAIDSMIKKLPNAQHAE